jgi:hypothetical protein
MRRAFLALALMPALAACGGSSSGTTAVVPIERASDLAIIGVEFTPASPRAGEAVTASVQWADLAGNEPFPVLVTIELVVEPDALGRICSWESDRAAGTVTCDFAGWTDPGRYRWDAWVDTRRVVEEPNEGNNTLNGTIAVGE